MFHKILVAIDDSESSQTIFEQAVALAKANQAELMLLHVLEPYDQTYPGDPYIGIPRAALQVYWSRWQEREQAGLERLRSLEATATAVGVVPEFTQSVGDPGRSICSLARTWNADLIVMGRRGLSGIKEFWLGSVSNYVLHHAPCHVLTIQGSVQTQTQPESETSTLSSI